MHAVHRKGGEPAPVHAELPTLNGSWLIDDTLSSGFGTYVCLALDAGDGVHLVFDQAGGAQYMFRPDGGAWTAPVLIEAGIVTGCSLAIDNTGGVHVAYTVGISDFSVRYAFKAPGSAWVAQQIDPVGEAVRLAIDSAGVAHVTYFSRNWGLQYATNPASSWLVETVDALMLGAEVGRGSDIAIGADDRVHISYLGMGNTQVRYANGFAGTWQKQSAYTVIGGGRTSIAVDRAGGVHVTMLDDQPAGVVLKYGYRCP